MASIGHAVRKSSITSTGLLNLLSRILLPLGLFAIALFGAGVNAAHAAQPEKVSSDLRKVLASGGNAKWTANTSKGRYVQVVISTISSDASLAALRAAIISKGGSVLYRYQSTPALLAIVPASELDALVARNDVTYVVPNRAAHRTLSFEEQITGVGALRASNPSSFTGAGVGIGVLFGDRHVSRRVRRQHEWQQWKLQGKQPHRCDGRFHQDFVNIAFRLDHRQRPVLRLRTG
jgi:hypothetical protein